MADDAQRRAAFRRWVRVNHPDVGGDPAVFAAGMQAARDGRWIEPDASPAPPRQNHRRPTVYALRSARGISRLVVAAKRWNDRRRLPPRVR